MTNSKHSRTRLYAVLGTAAVVIIGAVIALNTQTVEHATGEQSKTFNIEVDFDRFRQIMVRKNGTASIIGLSGMKLLDERLEDVELDTSGDDRPILNAIRGKSKTDVSATKLLTVQIDDPTLEADKLHLRQVADIEPQEINVVTASMEPAGKLQKYKSTLRAHPRGQSTELTINVDITILVRVPKLFASRAHERVQKAADDAVTNQAGAMTKFFAKHSDEQLILPEFGRQSHSDRQPSR